MFWSSSSYAKNLDIHIYTISVKNFINCRTLPKKYLVFSFLCTCMRDAFKMFLADCIILIWKLSCNICSSEHLLDLKKIVLPILLALKVWIMFFIWFLFICILSSHVPFLFLFNSTESVSSMILSMFSSFVFKIFAECSNFSLWVPQYEIIGMLACSNFLHLLIMLHVRYMKI